MKHATKAPYRTDYVYIDATDFHQKRGRHILKHYPQVKALMKTYPWSAMYITIIVALQIALGAWVESEPWWVMLTVAFFVGAVASHALFVLLHDVAHSLVFKNAIASKLISIFTNIGQGIPSGISFKEFHLKHHAHFTDYKKDIDIPLESEGRLIRNIVVLKMLWLFNMGLVQLLRPMGRSMKVVNTWSLINLIVVVITNVLIGYFLGWYALLYILLSTFFGLGVHPLGARWVQEHFIFKEGQQTYSYYGIGNKFAFNVGYHNEHHDLMNIPWVNLPKLKRMVPELYKSLYAHTSWAKLYFRFIFDKKISLFDRGVKVGTR